MVYCGKPSKGCSNCRGRKIRCDARAEGCSQCVKRQQECPGYRNLTDLMFRDESSHVIKKAKAKARKRAHLGVVSPSSSPESEEFRPSVTPDPPQRRRLSLITPTTTEKRPPTRNILPPLDWSTDSGSLLPSPDSGSWPTTPLIAMLYNLHPTAQERGTAFFFSRYVATNDENCCHQRFDFVYDVWRPASLIPERQVDGVLASMTAVGLIGLARTTRSEETMDAGRKSYGTALRLANQALRDPVECVKDTTMLAILVLSLFETMVEMTPETLQAWQRHVDGAATLANARGVDQFRTPGGTKMFLMLCQKVMLSSFQRQIPMPPSLIDLRNELGKTLDIQDPAWRIDEPKYKMLQARYDMKLGLLTDPEEIITRMLSIDSKFESILSQFPPEWSYRTIIADRRHPAIFQGLCHVYPSLTIASTWNSVRTCRIILLETVLSQLQLLLAQGRATPEHSAAFRQARHKLASLRDAIIASVPQHIGLVSSRNLSHPNNDMNTPISSVTVRETPSPATSPASMVGSPGSVVSGTSRGRYRPSTSGPTLADPLKASDDPYEEARRFMLLASSTNTIIWPLFVVGVSSVCGQDGKAYLVERLHALCAETGDRTADAVAGMVEECEIGGEWAGESVGRSPFDGGMVESEAEYVIEQSI